MTDLEWLANEPCEEGCCIPMKTQPKDAWRCSPCWARMAVEDKASTLGSQHHWDERLNFLNEIAKLRRAYVVNRTA